MKEPVFVVIKPDGIQKQLTGAIFDRLDRCGLELIGAKLVQVSPKLAENHYAHIKGTEFFDGVVSYLTGKLHEQKSVWALIYYGDEAIQKCRCAAGATNPEDASPVSIRGAMGRITREGVFENLVHVSSSTEDTAREIKLWFAPDEILMKIYETKHENVHSGKKRVWL